MPKKFLEPIDVPEAAVRDFLDIVLVCANCNETRGKHLDRKKCMFGPGEFKDVLGEGAKQVEARLRKIPKMNDLLGSRSYTDRWLDV